MKTSSDLGQSVTFALLLVFSSVAVILLMSLVGH
jgi:hypothetical protein